MKTEHAKIYGCRESSTEREIHTKISTLKKISNFIPQNPKLVRGRGNLD